MMKKGMRGVVLTLLLLCLTIPAFAARSDGTAYAAQCPVDIDGKTVTFNGYVLKGTKGGSTTYLLLRDVAEALNGTAAQFNVSWDGGVVITTGTAYTDRNGSEMSAPFTGNQAYRINANEVKVDGKAVKLDAITITDKDGKGHTYFKLRDLGAALAFTVDWSAASGTSIITGGFPDDGGYYVKGGDAGGLGDVMHTYFMDFLVAEAYTCASLGSYAPAGDSRLLVVKISVKNTMTATLPMYDVDFRVRWGGTEDGNDYAWPVTTSAEPYTNQVKVKRSLSPEQLPGEYEVAVNETRTGLLVYQVPASETEFSLSFQEYFSDGSQGDSYRVAFTAEAR